MSRTKTAYIKRLDPLIESDNYFVLKHTSQLTLNKLCYNARDDNIVALISE